MDGNILSFTSPASDWNEAFPVGCGRLGAMVFGGVGTELLQLNEDSVWYGGPKDRINLSAKDAIPKIRKAIDEGRITEAQDLCALALSGIPDTQSHYEPLCNLYILFDHETDDTEEYRRELDLEESGVRITYKKDGAVFRRSVIASFPDKVIATDLGCDKPGRISFRTQIARGNITWDMRPYKTQIYRNPGYNSCVDSIENTGGNVTVLTGRCGGSGSSEFACGIKVICKGGSVSSVGSSIVVEGADEAQILIAATSEFYESDIRGYLDKTLEDAAAKGFRKIQEDHRADYKWLYGRTSLTLPEGQQDVVRMFNFGKYLTISGSRPGSQPLNLQGIWNKDTDPAWGSKYTININTEMNYWPCEALDLPECHLPLMDLIERMKPRGQEVARRMYGARGFAAHHNTDLFGDCAPQDTCLSSTYWVLGAAWLCLHIWEHYRYTGDVAFLSEHFDTMVEAAVFIVDYKILDNGYLALSPTLSPENEYVLENGETGCVCKGASMDDQIIGELFGAVLKAEDILKTGRSEIEEIREAMNLIKPVTIGSDGRILEWHEEYEEKDPGHRHISHLFGLFPGTSIQGEELIAAATETLAKRLESGSGHTGWSRAWIINLYAAAGQGEEAYKHLRLLMSNSLLPNLLDNHPPFQIDGNFGLVSGIIRMILGREGECLPALPAAWKSGSVRGLKLPGGDKIDLVWEDGKVVSEHIYHG
ncbi:MAG: glycoside hydrolase family 95 protein [Clostridiales bacterium]|nr:glycoside hydrolase family 95 protein [Clostridiales bacterium]